ncbi:hypothetical protein [Chryseobacterium sediminis]|uniref:C1q domain-containing protein n=1 Tax=Chryseobacterium sediminis TaxID=1679494 RepID=A0A5B2TNA9_9FLAO|nr:hypothetical protein [Chryseobacterium sediminis]KAA2215699.1 hypothetical protein FW780_21530 [Chryseobacterium sediminis]
MNFKFYFFVIGLFSSFFYCQVGINTSDPTATLDVNGNTRIRTALVLPDTESANKIMAFDSNNLVSTIDLNRIFSNSPNGQTIIKGLGGAGFSVLPLSLLSGWQKVSFPVLEIDEGLNFNSTNQEFTAPKTGIYNLYFFLDMASLSSASTLGAGIFKVDGTTGITSLLSEESFLNISVLGINVSSPVRKTQTIVKLNAGDKIVFGMKAPLLDIGLFANSKASFTIWRMK